MHSACAAVKPFVDCGAAAVELTDRASLRAVEGKPGVPERWKALPASATGLLVEFRAPDEPARAAAQVAADRVLAGLDLLEPAQFTRDPAVAAQYWTVRSGLLASVGGARPSGTSFILEDVCFPPARLADGALDLQELFGRHGYAGVIFGHASAGNLHFLITPLLNEEREIARFDAFMQDVVDLVVGKYDGSLKAEHGTGRNIAPFVEREWGEKLTALMWKLKRLADPDGVLAPGVMLARDPQHHLQHLQTSPSVEDSVDRCIQCGYCERVCPSRSLTTTPRQRIALRREMVRQGGASPMQDALLRDYDYDAIQTCAGDGSCELACPVGINTGALMKAFRHQEHGRTAEGVAATLARQFLPLERVARVAVGAAGATAKLFGHGALTTMTNAARAVVSRDLMPGWLPNMPAAAKATLPPTRREGAAAVYFVACVNRIFGHTPGHERESSLAEALVAVSARAGLPLWIPDDVGGHCCATIWHSKGYEDGNALMANRTAESLWRWSEGGRLPIVCDASSCSFGITSEIVPYLTPENRDTSRAARHPRLDRLGARSPAAQAHRRAQARVRGGPSELLDAASGRREEAARPRRGHGRHGGDACLGQLLRLRRRPRLPAHRAHALGDGGGGRRGRRARLRRVSRQQPHLRDRAQSRHRKELRVVRLPARGAVAAGGMNRMPDASRGGRKQSLRVRRRVERRSWASSKRTASS